jgi:uncharacterized protein involved in exopolysaccharide biosynthesis
MQNNPMTIQDDEIDLRELWATLVKRMLTLFITTAVVTVSAIFYAWTATPVYRGDVLIEIGDVIINSEATNDKPTIIISIENPSNLKEIITSISNDKKGNPEITVEAPKGSNNLIRLSYEDTDKKIIQTKLEQATGLILERHQTKALFLQKANAQIRPTSIVSDVTITPDPIKPKKALIVIVGLISGLMMGIFGAFFLEFIQNNRNKEE